MITLILEPNRDPMSWQEFCTQTPTHSVAIDGYVNTGPEFQRTKDGGPRANFNHHEGVDRLATRATCAQVLMAVRTGFYKTFRSNNEIHCNVYANDNDQDVCTAYFILKNPWFCEHTINPLLNKLVDIEDRLDATGGAYPYPRDMPILKTLAWIFEPYTTFRLKGGLDSGDTHAFQAIVNEVETRIGKYLHGQSSSIPINTEYETLYRNSTWALVREKGAQARTGMLNDGIYAYISVRERGNGIWSHTIGRTSQFIDFDVPELLPFLSSCEDNPRAKWGGGSTSGINIGGSSRKFGSSQSPDDLIKNVGEYLRIK